MITSPPLIELKKVQLEPVEGLPEFLEKYYNEAINQLNITLKSLSMRNFGGQIYENITIPALSSVELNHSLGRRPRYRITLRQDGIGIIDKYEDWTTSRVVLENTSASDITISFTLLLE